MLRSALRVGAATLGVVVLWAAVVVVGTLQGWGKTPLAPRGDTVRFMDAATAYLDSRNVGNAVFALLDGGSIHGVHGVSIGEPVDENTLFQVASLSKWITAWGVMALVEERKLDLDAPVRSYLKRWTLPASRFDNDQVTVRRLLSHTAGLTDGLGYAGFEPGAVVQSIEESLARTADASPGASGVVAVGVEPGSEWRYSGGGYSILQLLIEEVSGESFEDFMQRAVLRPLGMTRSTFHWLPDGGATLASFYGADSRPATHYRFAALAAASLYTSTSDLVRFLQAQLPGPNGEPIGRGVLEPATLHEMWKPHASSLGADIWGLGAILYASNGAGGFVVGHDGSNAPAINTSARLNPATGDGIVVLGTGSPLLASQLAGEWVFWETGNIDVLALTISTPRMIRWIGLGSVAIAVGLPTLFWLIRRRS